MFGYATDETPELMPLPITLAHRLGERLAAMRRETMKYLRPDGKSQVTVRYEDGVPKEVTSVVISTQHAPEISADLLRDEVISQRHQAGPRGLRHVARERHHLLHQPDRHLRGRRPARRLPA